MTFHAQMNRNELHLKAPSLKETQRAFELRFHDGSIEFGIRLVAMVSNDEEKHLILTFKRNGNCRQDLASPFTLLA